MQTNMTPDTDWTATDAFYAPSGTLISIGADDWSQVQALIDGGICEWCYIDGKRVLITL